MSEKGDEPFFTPSSSSWTSTLASLCEIVISRPTESCNVEQIMGVSSLL